MTGTEWKDRTDIISNIVVIFAALAGGLWAVFRFWRERTDEAALDLTVSQRSSPHGNDHLVAITLELANRGKTRIQAKTKRTKSGFAFDDTVEKLAHSCSLQVRKFTTPASTMRIDWFEAGHVVQNVPGWRRPSSCQMASIWQKPPLSGQVAIQTFGARFLPSPCRLSHIRAISGDQRFSLRV